MLWLLLAYPYCTRVKRGKTLSLIGVLLVFISSLTYAIYIIGVNRSSLKDMPTAKLTFYALLFGLSVFVVRLKFCTHLDPISTPWLWINPIGLALFPTVISLVAMTKSIHYIGSTPAAILGALGRLQPYSSVSWCLVNALRHALF